MKRVGIIGAGIGGLATACLLAKAGYDVTVYEKNQSAGGKAGVLHADGFRFDTGPSWYLMPEVFQHFFSLFGEDATALLDVIQLDPAYKVFFEHQPPVTITADFATNKAIFEAIETGAGERLDRYIAQSTTIYKLALKHFLYTNFRSLRDVVHPDILRSAPRMLSMALTNVDSYVAKQFHDQRLKQILEYPMVFLGASPYETPALYSLMSALDFTSGVYYPRRGLYSMIDALQRIAQSLGVHFVMGTSVEHIATSDKKVCGLVLSSGERVEADIVVSNADVHFTETALLSPSDQTYPERYWRRRNPGPSALLLYLGVRGALPEFAHHSLLFVDDWRDNFTAIYKTKTLPKNPSIYLSRATATDPSLAPAGHEALVVLVPLPADIHLTATEQATFAEQIIAQIARMSGVSDLADRIVSQTIMPPQAFGDEFNAWRYGALGPAHTLGQSAVFRTGNRSRRVANLYYVGGSTLPGIGLPMCLISAQLVYKHLAGDRRGGQLQRVKRLVEEE